LVEIMVVMTVVLILAAMIWKLGGRLDTQSKERQQKEAFAILDGALQAYYDVTGDFPVVDDANIPTEVVYQALESVADSRAVLARLPMKFIANKLPVGQTQGTGPEIYDAWGHLVTYEWNQDLTFPELRSYGRNGVPDVRSASGSDDITN